MSKKKIDKHTSIVSQEEIEAKKKINEAKKPATKKAKPKYDMEKLKADSNKMVEEAKGKKTEGKRIMTIAETKFGLGIYLSKGDCKALGLDLNSYTKPAIKEVRAMLKLPEKQIKE